MKKVFLFASMFLAVGLLNMSAAFYSDVDQYSPYAPAITWMEENQVINGYSDGTFKPDQCVNRSELLKMIMAVLKWSTNEEAALFSDVPADAWFTPYVKTARARGAIVGYSDGTFRPGQCVTRAEAVKMAVMIFNNGSVPDYTTYNNSYSDIVPGDWYYSYLDYAISIEVLGLVHVKDNIFGANSGMSRAEVSEMLYRMKALKDNSSYTYYNWGLTPLDVNFVPFYKACTMPTTLSYDNLPLETIFPAGSDGVIKADSSDSTQVESLKNILLSFVETAAKETLLQDFSNMSESEDPYGLMDILNSDWQLALAIDGMTDASEGNIFVAFKSKEPEKLRILLGEMFSDEYRTEIVCSKNGDFLYWTNETEEFYFVNYGDLFALTNSSANREDIVQRIKDKETGFVWKDTSRALMKGHFKYSDLMDWLDLSGDVSATFANAYSKLYGDMDFSVSADNTGLSFKMLTDVLADTNARLNSFKGYTLTLIDKVPTDGLLFYYEEPNLKLMISEVMYALEVYYVESADLAYETFLDEIVAEFSMKKDYLKPLLNNPFALSVNDIGREIPGVMLYIKLYSDLLDEADVVLSDMDFQFDEYFSKIAADNSLNVSDFYKREKGWGGYGSVVRKITVNVNKLPENLQWDYDGMTGTDNTFEFYYGYNEDNIFVLGTLAGYPDKYGKTGLSYDGKYRQALEKLNGIYGSNMIYADLNALTAYLKRTGLTDETAIDVLEKLGYFISSVRLDGNVYKNNMYLKINY